MRNDGLRGSWCVSSGCSSAQCRCVASAVPLAGAGSEPAELSMVILALLCIPVPGTLSSAALSGKESVL